MSSRRLAFSSDRLRPLSSLTVDERAVVADVHAHEAGRAERLLAMGVTPGAAVTMLQTFPGVVFLCDQTELPHTRKKRKDLFSVHHSLFTIHFITAPIYNFRDNFFLQIGWPVQNW